MGTKTLAPLALAAALVSAPAAYADPSSATHWVGLPDSDHGFLVDTETGAAWMTGGCLVPLKNAVKTGNSWTVREAGMVSAGRAMAMLDQTFEFTLDPAAPSFSVTNPARGGRQSFAAALKSCDAGACTGLAAQPVCEQ